MNDLQNMVVDYLLGPFTTDRPTDREDLARLLQKFFPEMPFDELTVTVNRVANGVAFRIKDAADVGPLPIAVKRMLSR
jgi:hypothetical protein